MVWILPLVNLTGCGFAEDYRRSAAVTRKKGICRAMQRKYAAAARLARRLVADFQLLRATTGREALHDRPVWVDEWEATSCVTLIPSLAVYPMPSMGAFTAQKAASRVWRGAPTAHYTPRR